MVFPAKLGGKAKVLRMAFKTPYMACHTDMPGPELFF